MKDGPGKRVAVQALTRELGEALGWSTPFDVGVLSETVMHRIELEVAAQLDTTRETFEAAITAALEYMRRVNLELEGRVNQLKSENERLTRQLARQPELAPR